MYRRSFLATAIGFLSAGTIRLKGDTVARDGIFLGDCILSMRSDKNDYIGQGMEYIFHGTASLFVNNNALRFMCGEWTAEFAAPNAKQLVVGHYSDARRYMSVMMSDPGMHILGQGRGCNDLTGCFIVKKAVYENGSPKLLNIQFEQHNLGLPQGLYGTLSYQKLN